MGMTIIDGKLTLGGLGSQYYKEGTREAEIANALAMTIQATNTEEVKASSKFTAFALALQTEVERVDGQPIPLEIHNVWFSKGGIMSEANGFDTYYKNFTMKKGEGLQVKAFSHDQKEILDARNSGLDLLAKDKMDIDRISKAYINRYIPNVSLLPLITGSSLTYKVPTKATESSDDDITRAFGWLRGEDVSDFLPATQGITHANHYRAKKGAVLNQKDITDLVDLIESYDSYSGQGVVAIAHPRVISDLGALYSSPANQDKMVIDGVITPNFLGVSWIDCTQMSKEFIIFVDGGKVGSLVKRCVNKDEEQRGFKLIEENKIEGYAVDSGLQGIKAYIFEEEYIVDQRWSGGILDIARHEASGLMDSASITALEKYAKTVQEMYLK